MQLSPDGRAGQYIGAKITSRDVKRPRIYLALCSDPDGDSCFKYLPNQFNMKMEVTFVINDATS